MTINRGKRIIKRELWSQELKIPIQQNRKGNEKVRSLACKCVLAYVGDSVFPGRGRRPSLLPFQVEWTTTNTISLNYRERMQSCLSGFLLPRNKELHWKSQAILEVTLSLFTSLKRFSKKVSSPLGFLPFVWREGTWSLIWLWWSCRIWANFGE